MNRYEVQIVERRSGNVVQSIPAQSIHQAERVQRGASINLNHKDYRVKIQINKEVGEPR